VLETPNQAAEVAYNFMMLFGNSLSYWLLVRLAAAAQEEINKGTDDNFYWCKISSAKFFASQILVRNSAYLAAISSASIIAGEQIDKQLVQPGV